MFRVIVNSQLAGDAEIVVSAGVPPRREEHLLDHILRAGPIADDPVRERVDGAAEPFVQLGQRRVVAGADPLQQGGIDRAVRGGRRVANGQATLLTVRAPNSPTSRALTVQPRP